MNEPVNEPVHEQADERPDEQAEKQGSGPDGLPARREDASWWSAAERRRLTRLCAVLTGDASAADDLAQETLVQAWRIRDRLTEPSGHRAWLDAIARHVCRRWRVREARRLAHERPRAEVPGPQTGHDHLGGLLEREELVDLLDRALALLPPDTREALVARYVEELPPAEIARRLSVSAEAVSMRLTRGRRRLRHLLETDLADEPLAQAWVSRCGSGWRATRLRCGECGRATVTVRRDERAGRVELRCTGCDSDGIGAAYRLDHPQLGPLLTGISRPSTVVARMAAWSWGFWPDAIARGQAPCTRCGADVTVAAYERPGSADPRSARGWWVSCARCGEELSTSLSGFALVQPETLRLRRSHPGLRAVPTREVEYDGRAGLVVGLRDEVSGAGVDLLVDRETTRPVAVVPTDAPARRCGA